MRQSVLTRVSDLDRFRKDLICQVCEVQQVFKITAPDLISVSVSVCIQNNDYGQEPGKARDGEAQFLHWGLLERPQPSSLLRSGTSLGDRDQPPSEVIFTHEKCKQKTSLTSSWHSLTLLLSELIAKLPPPPVGQCEISICTSAQEVLRCCCMSDSCKTRVLGRSSFMVIYSCHRKLPLLLFVSEFILLGSAARYCKCSKSLTIKSRGQRILRKV